MSSETLGHKLAINAFNTALLSLASGHRHRYLHIGHALNQSDDAWGNPSGAARRFDDLVDASHDSRFKAMANALRTLRDEHEQNIE